jgi:signal transduction histidine kinase/ActR/RegA family two-component response regulator
MINNNQKSTFVDIYNNAYRSYLSHINPNIFIHTLLNQFIRELKLNIFDNNNSSDINGICGVIMGYNHEIKQLNLMTHTSDMEKNTLCTQQSVKNNHNSKNTQIHNNNLWFIFSNYIHKHKNLNDSSLIMKHIMNQEVNIYNDCTILDVLGSNSINDLYEESSSNNKLSDLPKGTVIMLPFCFNNITNGFMMICSNYNCTYQNISILQNNLQSFCLMMGVLFNNIAFSPIHKINHVVYKDNNTDDTNNIDYTNNIADMNNIDHSITYQLVYDALNIVSDNIVITDSNMRIMYKNEKFISLVKNKKLCCSDDISNNLIDIFPQTISLIGTIKDKNISNFYTNKKISIMVENESKNNIDIYVNSTVAFGSTYHILRVCDILKSIGTSASNKFCTNSKNLIAYLSHELRNPIQAISTGVYIIDRTIKNIDINNNIKKSALFSDNRKRSNSKTCSPEIIRANKRSYINFNSENNDIDIKSTIIEKNIKIDSSLYEVIDADMVMMVSQDQDQDQDQDQAQEQAQDHEQNITKKEILESLESSNSCSNSSTLSSSIYSYNDISDDINPLDEINTLKSIIKRVYSACKNMSIIIDDILDLSKIDNDELVINLDDHNLREITDLIVEEAENEITKKGLILEYDFCDNNTENIYTDSTRLFQILSNLISNSIKYSNTGVIKFKVTYDDINNNVIFQVSDQGQGIRKEELSNLFKEFGRTSNSVTDINSTGLGLCVCQKIANILGGSIEVSSEYKKGSTFTFIHPIKLRTNITNKINKEIIINSNNQIKGRILIVDDDQNITSLFKLLLRCMNYDCGYDLMIETACTGDKALYLSSAKKFDLIFMDIDLDGEDGYTVCEQIRSQIDLNKNTPMVAVTANIKYVQNELNIKNIMFNDIILKPFNNKDIKKYIIKYLS